MRWFVPAPWTAADCRIDLRPGGQFHFVMRSPEGQRFPYTGTYLEIVPERRLVWTLALLPGFRPAVSPPAEAPPVFTVVVSLTADGAGTAYTVVAMHADPSAAAKHAEMGFHEGWGQCLDQLVELAHTLHD